MNDTSNGALEAGDLNARNPEADGIVRVEDVEHHEQVDVAVVSGDQAVEPDNRRIEFCDEVGNDNLGPFAESETVPNGFAVLNRPPDLLAPIRVPAAVNGSPVMRFVAGLRCRRSVHELSTTARQSTYSLDDTQSHD